MAIITMWGEKRTFKDAISNHEWQAGFLHLFQGNTFVVENAFCLAYPSSHHLDSPADLQWGKEKIFLVGMDNVVMNSYLKVETSRGPINHYGAKLTITWIAWVT